MSDKEVQEWKKRVNAKRGPFYLLDSHMKDGNTYYHIGWREKHRHGHMVAKLGWLNDGMMCRYGISTYCTLAGETPFDFQHGSCKPEVFETLVKIYKKEFDDLEIFDLDVLRNLKH